MFWDLHKDIGSQDKTLHTTTAFLKQSYLEVPLLHSLKVTIIPQRVLHQWRLVKEIEARSSSCMRQEPQLAAHPSLQHCSHTASPCCQTLSLQPPPSSLLLMWFQASCQEMRHQFVKWGASGARHSNIRKSNTLHLKPDSMMEDHVQRPEKCEWRTNTVSLSWKLGYFVYRVHKTFLKCTTVQWKCIFSLMDFSCFLFYF